MILQMTRPVQGALRQVRKFEIGSNHLANVDTPGFKSDILSFDYLFKARLTHDLTQGPLRTTDNQLDFALNDEGFFKIQTPRGIRYTRNGNFMVNVDGALVTQQGDTVLDDGDAPIFINGDRVHVTEDGAVEVDGEIVGQLNVVTFTSLDQLQKEGSSLYVYKGDPADEVAPPNVSIKQGALEGSNGSVVVEMTNMIDYQRMFEAQQKMMRAFDETDSKVINDVGRTL
ncbi:MAG: flagellar hook-basal body protein [Desulfobacterales bacterium]|nr:flagellar hook-basal body protein [Desulfobacterales bacterium]